MSSGVGSFLSNFADSYSATRDRAERRAEREDERASIAGDRQDDRSFRREELAYRNDELAYRRSINGGGDGAGDGTQSPLLSTDPANASLPAHQRAFLNAVSDGESGGAYDVRYSPQGGATFDASTNQHPQVYEAGPHGPSSAAGRYQFTWSTWRDIAGADTPFTRENQDSYAWQLAERDYRARTGGDLDADLQENGMTDGIMSALAPTWQAFGNEDRRGRYSQTYSDSLSRYNTSSSEAGGRPEARSIYTGPLAGVQNAIQDALQPMRDRVQGGLDQVGQKVRDGLSFGSQRGDAPAAAPAAPAARAPAAAPAPARAAQQAPAARPAPAPAAAPAPRPAARPAPAPAAPAARAKAPAPAPVQSPAPPPRRPAAAPAPAPAAPAPRSINESAAPAPQKSVAEALAEEARRQIKQNGAASAAKPAEKPKPPEAQKQSSADALTAEMQRQLKKNSTAPVRRTSTPVAPTGRSVAI